MSLVDMNTEVVIQVNKRKKVNKEAMVVEAFNKKYIKVDIVDEEDHVFELRWNGFMYEGNFLDMTMNCQYNVEKDFSAVKTTHGTDLEAPVVRRKKSGRPVSMQS
jgi:hypothetical protein